MASIHSNSSAIASADYDKETGTLVISFTKGGSHSYSNVPQEVVDAFQRASSKGKFFNAAIRNEY